MKQLLASLLTLIILLSFPVVSFATGDSELMPAEFAYCKQAGALQSECEACGDGKIFTALGCISFRPADFAQDLLTVSIGIAGGLALLLMLYGSFILATSSGQPDQTQKGKEIIGGAVSGLFIIVFSLVILRVIGIEILQIPGF